jgi:hypothetical protein
MLNGQRARPVTSTEVLFFCLRSTGACLRVHNWLEDQVPETHLLRLIERHIGFAFVRETFKQSYSETGWPSIDPELMLRILLIGFVWHHQRTQTDRGVAPASGLAMVHAITLTENWLVWVD